MKKFILCLVMGLVPSLSDAQTVDDYLYDDSTLEAADCCSFPFFYVKGSVGYDYPYHDLEFILPFSPLGAYSEASFGLMSKIPSYQLGFGYDFGKFRAEIEGDGGFFGVEDFAFTLANVPDVDLDELNNKTTVEGDVAQIKVMANVLVDFYDEYTLFQPYIGLGAGLTWYDADLEVTSVERFDLGSTLKPFPIGQGIVGVNINTFDFVFFDISYRFYSTLNERHDNVVEISVPYDPDATFQNGSVQSTNPIFMNHIVEVGARVPLRY